MSKYIAIGKTSQTQLQKYVKATIGLADQTGRSFDDIAGKFIRAQNGFTRGLIQLGVVANDGASAQQMLNEALERGQDIFQNIEQDAPYRTVMRLRTQIQNLTKEMVQALMPALNTLMQITLKFLKPIAGLLVGGAIFGALKAIQKMLITIAGSSGIILGNQRRINKQQLKLNRLKLQQFYLQVGSKGISDKRLDDIYESTKLIINQNERLRQQLTLRHSINAVLKSSNF